MFGPWVLVAQKGKPSRNTSKVASPDAKIGSSFHSPIKPLDPISLVADSQPLGFRSSSDKARSSVMGANRTSTIPEKIKPKPKSMKGISNTRGQELKKTSQGQTKPRATRQKTYPE